MIWVGSDQLPVIVPGISSKRVYHWISFRVAGQLDYDAVFVVGAEDE